MAHNLMSLPHGGKAPAAGDERNHNDASKMAFAASRKLNVARELAGKSARAAAPKVPANPAGPGDYREHIATAAAHVGAMLHPQHVHAAIDRLTVKGRFTPTQNTLLKQHQGPLEGPNGAKTMQSILGEALAPNTGQV